MLGGPPSVSKIGRLVIVGTRSCLHRPHKRELCVSEFREYSVCRARVARGIRQYSSDGIMKMFRDSFCER